MPPKKKRKPPKKSKSAAAKYTCKCGANMKGTDQLKAHVNMFPDCLKHWPSCRFCNMVFGEHRYLQQHLDRSANCRGDNFLDGSEQGLFPRPQSYKKVVFPSITRNDERNNEGHFPTSTYAVGSNTLRIGNLRDTLVNVTDDVLKGGTNKDLQRTSDFMRNIQSVKNVDNEIMRIPGFDNEDIGELDDLGFDNENEDCCLDTQQDDSSCDEVFDDRKVPGDSSAGSNNFPNTESEVMATFKALTADRPSLSKHQLEQIRMSAERSVKLKQMALELNEEVGVFSGYDSSEDRNTYYNPNNAVDSWKNSSFSTTKEGDHYLSTRRSDFVSRVSMNHSIQLSSEICSQDEERVSQIPLAQPQPDAMAMIFDITSSQKKLRKYFQSFVLTPSEIKNLELFEICKKSNAPMALYNRVVDWSTSFNITNANINPMDQNPSLNIRTRETFIQTIVNKLYPDEKMMKPVTDVVRMPFGGYTARTTRFRLLDYIHHITCNKLLFQPEWLLLDPKDPCSLPPENEFYGDINSGDWHRLAHNITVRGRSNHILMPFIFFIDGLKIDKFSRKNIEPVFACCGWFNRKARNRSEFWFPLGYINDAKIIADLKKEEKSAERILALRNAIIKHIFADFKMISDNGGVRLSLDFGNGDKYDNLVALPVIQFIIGDCEGHDSLCGRKKGHTRKSLGLCRDCNIKTNEEPSNPNIGRRLTCTWNTVQNMTENDGARAKELSFYHPNTSAFLDLSFGGCRRGVFGNTPPEILHQIKLGIIVYMSEAFTNMFTKVSTEMINKYCRGIVANSRRQSARGFPVMFPFKNGLNSIASLKADEKFARLFVMYTVLLNSHLIRRLTGKESNQGFLKTTKKMGAARLTRELIFNFVRVVEEVLIFHQWLKLDRIRKSDLEAPLSRDDDEDEPYRDSKAQNAIKHMMGKMKTHLVRGESTSLNVEDGGIGWDTTKFHQLLHLCDYIQRHGVPMNYDGSRGENMGKERAKDLAKLTNQNDATMLGDVAKRYFEDHCLTTASNLHFIKTGTWVSSSSRYSTEDDIGGDEMGSSLLDVKERRMFDLNVKIRNHSQANLQDDIDEELVYDILDVECKWRKGCEPDINFDSGLIAQVAVRLFAGSPNLQGTIDINSQISGFTMFRHNHIIYRAHPCYSGSGPWYDWAYFEWEGLDELIPCKMYMFLDLCECTIKNGRTSTGQNALEPQTFLRKDLWAVVSTAIEGEAPYCRERIPPRQRTREYQELPVLNDNHYQSRVAKRIFINKELWLVPLSCIQKPAFVIEETDYGRFPESKLNDTNTFLSAYCISPIENWGELFVN